MRGSSEGRVHDDDGDGDEDDDGDYCEMMMVMCW